MVRRGVCQHQQIVWRVLVVRCHVQRHHLLQCNLGYLVSREEGVSFHVEELTLIRVRQHWGHSWYVVGCVEAEQLHQPVFNLIAWAIADRLVK